MPRPRTRHRFSLAAVAFHRKNLGPILPVFIFDNDRDRRSNRLRMSNAADDARPIGLNLHAPAAPEPLLPAPQFTIDRRNRNRNSRGNPRNRRHQALPVRLPRCLKPEHANHKSNKRGKLFPCRLTRFCAFWLLAPGYWLLLPPPPNPSPSN